MSKKQSCYYNHNRNQYTKTKYQHKIHNTKSDTYTKLYKIKERKFCLYQE